MSFFRKKKGTAKKSLISKYRHLLPELLISIIGTIIGVVVTVGVTYYSEKNDKESMARKIAMLTIHNLDVSINSMSRLVNEMSRQDSIFQYLKAKQTSSEFISPDTLNMFISGFYSHKIRPID